MFKILKIPHPVPDGCNLGGPDFVTWPQTGFEEIWSAMRVFFIKTLKRNWSVEETPYPKRPIRLPEILSREEVERLINSADNPLHRVWLLTLYATGVRREELVRLKVNDIDSARMVLHIHQGKGNQDRHVMLSPRLLEELREYWRRMNPKPKTYLFRGGGRAHATGVPMRLRYTRRFRLCGVPSDCRPA